MGWTYTNKPANLREFFNREFNYDKPAEGRSGKLIAFAQRGWSEAYGAYEIKTATETRVVGLAMMIRFTRAGEFGYKEMSEEMGPNISNCPKSILKLLTPLKEDEKYAAEWRKRCWERVDQRRTIRGIKIGSVIKFKTPLRFQGGLELDTFEVAEVKPLRLRSGYTLCRIKRDTIASAVADGTAEIIPPTPKLFSMGKTVITQGAQAILLRHNLGMSAPQFFQRHEKGDWGDVGAEDAAQNNEHVKSKDMLLSSYPVGNEKLWIITDAGHQCTTCLSPDEY